jgi:transposase InsO family protein
LKRQVSEWNGHSVPSLEDKSSAIPANYCIHRLNPPPLPAADLLNDLVVPFFDSYGIALSRVLTDRGTEYCGNPEHHGYELYLAVENIDHTRTKARSPQPNGIVEQLHKTMLDAFYRIAFRRKIYDSIRALQTNLDVA